MGFLVVVLLVGGLSASAAFGSGRVTPSAATATTAVTAATAAPPVEFLNVTTTSQFSFVPGTLTVTPGATVHLRVTQAASFAHTFVLSPVANYTIPTSTNSSALYAFFQAHPPLVNLSVAGTPGATNSTIFTAPPVGVYEFVCIIPGHFQAGMYGFLHSTNQPTTSSSGSSPDYLLYVGIVVVIVVVLGLAVYAVRRRRTSGSGPAP
ncbi:copper-containing oxidoreductase signal peptide protein [mine drainage metagenome]|uniref:Copper-containing oxidoreductase signal peptide protein n=1 Tax=mine drainage metagenome TaxID=410659 RepID=T1A7Q6_9ZZZZ